MKLKSNNETYALKVIQKTAIKQQNMIAQVKNEIDIMYQITHPNIIQLFNHFEDDDYLFLLIEYAEGGRWLKIRN